MSELIAYHFEDGIATLTLSNGKVNAISPAVVSEFNAALDQAEKDRAVVIITGTPGILSGGYDLKVMTAGPKEAISLVTSGSTLARRMLAHPFPVIVACPGHAVAKGAFLLLSADYRIGVEGPFSLLDERHDIAHVEDARRHAVRMEGLEVGELLADGREHDRSARHRDDRKCGTSASIAVELGQDDGIEADTLLKLLGGSHGVLADHGVDHEQDVVGTGFVANIAQLLHQL